VDFVNGGGGWKKSLKVLKIEVKVIFQRVLPLFLLELCLKMIASVAIEEKLCKISVLGIKNHRSAAVRGGGTPGAPPWIR